MLPAKVYNNEHDCYFGHCAFRPETAKVSDIRCNSHMLSRTSSRLRHMLSRQPY
jgi:hypothetical protein